MFFIIKKIKYVLHLILNPFVVSNKIIKDIRKDFKIFTGFQLNSEQLNYNKLKKIY